MSEGGAQWDLIFQVDNEGLQGPAKNGWLLCPRFSHRRSEAVIISILWKRKLRLMEFL